MHQPPLVEAESAIIQSELSCFVQPRGAEEPRLIVVSDFLGERFSLTKFPLGREPKLNISSGWSAVFFPDFTRPFADLIFVRTGQSTRSLFQFDSQGNNALYRLPIANPPRKVAILGGLGNKARYHIFLIHRAQTSQ